MRREMFLNLLSHTTNQVYLNYISPSLVTMLCQYHCFDMFWEDDDDGNVFTKCDIWFYCIIASKTVLIH